jgi:trans-2-enoyl-CoA reductase
MRAKCKNQIKYVQSKGAIAGGKKVLVIDFYRFWFSFKDFKCFGSDAATIGVFETAYRRKNSLQVGIIQLLSKKKQRKGLYAKSVNGDAFLTR